MSKVTRVVYVVSLFPCWSETFIVREITTLIASGVDVMIVSLKSPSEKMVQPDAEALLPRAVHPLPTGKAVFAWLGAALAHFGTLASCSAAIVARLWREPKAMAK